MATGITAWPRRKTGHERRGQDSEKEVCPHQESLQASPNQRRQLTIRACDARACARARLLAHWRKLARLSRLCLGLASCVASRQARRSPHRRLVLAATSGYPSMRCAGGTWAHGAAEGGASQAASSILARHCVPSAAPRAPMHPTTRTHPPTHSAPVRGKLRVVEE